MRDLAFIGFLFALFGLGFKRPFLFVLAYVYIDLVSPQRLTYFLLNSIPVSLIAAAFAVGGWALADDKSGTRIAPRQWLILLLLAYCFWTTGRADFPVEAADKWGWVWKALAFAFFLPFTLKTKLRIEALLAFMILSASSIIIVGGIKTIFSGGGYGELNLMIDSNSGLYEGSTISTVAIAIIPMILWFTKHGTIFQRDKITKLYCYALIFACLLIPVGTSTRTGLLCTLLCAVMLLRDMKRKTVYLAVLGAIALIAVPFLPSSFTNRMSTIKTYQGDASASTRLAVWQWTWEFAKDHPFGGGFEAYRQNKIRYDTVKVVQEGDGTSSVQRDLQVDKARAYHSAYFEMLGEQGYPGILIWLMIQIGGLFRMEMVRRRYRKPEAGEEWVAPMASALQQGHILYMLGATFIGIAFQTFALMWIGAEIGLDMYLARQRAGASFRPMSKRAKPVPAVAA